MALAGHPSYRGIEDLGFQLAVHKALEDQCEVLYRFADRGGRSDLDDAGHRQTGIDALEGKAHNRLHVMGDQRATLVGRPGQNRRVIGRRKS